VSSINLFLSALTFSNRATRFSRSLEDICDTSWCYSVNLITEFIYNARFHKILGGFAIFYFLKFLKMSFRYAELSLISKCSYFTPLANRIRCSSIVVRMAVKLILTSYLCASYAPAIFIQMSKHVPVLQEKK
jgi:hypothetical protein